MPDLLAIALVGGGMFLLGWYAHAWLQKPREVYLDPLTSRWSCPKCERIKELPAELDRRVLVCNNCQVRLVKAA